MSNLPPSSKIAHSLPIAQLESLQIRAQRLAKGILSGLHSSLRQGAALEFSEHQEYHPGDPIRHLDWRVYGRRDKYYIKRFEEETELHILVLLDASGSMQYPQNAYELQHKFTYAKLLTACLAYIASYQNDAIGLHMMTESKSTQHHLPSAVSQFHQICQALDSFSAAGKTNLVEQLALLAARLSHKTMLFLFSDLLPPVQESISPEHYLHQFQAMLGKLQSQQHEIIVGQILHSDEIDFPFYQEAIFEDPETGKIWQGEPLNVKSAYQAQLTQYLQLLKAGLASKNIKYGLIRTNEDIKSTIVRLLR